MFFYGYRLYISYKICLVYFLKNPYLVFTVVIYPVQLTETPHDLCLLFYSRYSITVYGIPLKQQQRVMSINLTIGKMYYNLKCPS